MAPEQVLTNEISARTSDENSTDWDPYLQKNYFKSICATITSTPLQIMKAMKRGETGFGHILLEKSGTRIIDQLNCKDILH